MNKLKLIVIMLGVLVSGWLIPLSPVVAAAAIDFKPEVTIPGSDFKSGETKQLTSNSLCEYVVAWYKYLIATVGIVAALVIAFGGLQWLISAGNSGKVNKAKGYIMGGVSGLVLALCSYLILATINQELVVCKSIDVRSIAKQTRDLSDTVYTSSAQLPGTVAKDLDNSNQYKCCVISGRLWHGSTSIIDPTSGWCNREDGLVGTSIKRCATYQSASTAASTSECNNFYDNYKEYIASLGGYCRLRASAFSDKDEDSVKVYEGNCWTNTETAAWCVSKSDNSYCQNRSTGSSCYTANSAEGYCDNKVCNPCKKSVETINGGDACSSNYECAGRDGKCGGTDESVGRGDCNCNWLGGNCTCTYFK